MEPISRSEGVPGGRQGPKLLDQVYELARARRHSRPTAAGFVKWCKAYIVFHGIRHPQEMGFAEVGRYRVPRGTQLRIVPNEPQERMTV